VDDDESSTKARNVQMTVHATAPSAIDDAKVCGGKGAWRGSAVETDAHLPRVNRLSRSAT
jgi:hypothetical protein